MNRLAGETSPYLRQHRDHPVDWYPWGNDAFDAAKARGVPVLLSVGYSACHWCHVMAHECFEDVDVAATMNELFVNVKVDREERPDVDAVYMDAVQAMTGRGGWPMTVFLTPAGEPFYGGTYFPKPSFLQLMSAIDDVWRNRGDDVRQNVAALVEVIGRTATLRPANEGPGLGHLERAVASLGASFDPDWGGFGSAPKFPSTMSLDLVLGAHLRRGGEVPGAEAVVTTSLDAMASGGIYDHLRGGFARYSVDAAWLVPHFEKMLYDQALLVRAYVHGWQVFGHDRWRQVVEETVGYVLGDLGQSAGGFSSAEDADSLDEHGHSHEGLFYTWTPAELVDVLGPEAAAVTGDWFGVTEQGNFEGRNILNRMHHRGELARTAPVEQARARLLAARERRPRPGLDDKVLTEWNALMLSALAEAAGAFGRADWLQAAIDCGEFLLRELRRPDGRWHRSWQADGAPRARHAALAADHACLVDAFTRLGEASGEARWTAAAVECADVLLDHFWDPVNGGLFTTPDDGERLVVRQKDVTDSATPSANSSAAAALTRLAALTGEARYAHHADQILRLLAPLVGQAPSAFANALSAAELRGSGVTEVVVAGHRPDLVDVVRARWRPGVVLAWGERFDSPLWHERRDGFAYVCRDFACLAPTDDAAELERQLTN